MRSSPLRSFLRVGVRTRFHPTGEVRAQAEFANGLQQGWPLSLDDPGRSLSAVRFDAGSAIR